MGAIIGWLLNPRVLVALAIVAAIGAVYVKGRSDGAAPAEAKLERERAGWAQERVKAAELSRQASEAARATEAAWAASAARIQAEGEQRHAQLTADADRARRAAGSLRDALDIATHALRRGTAEAPATAAECAAAHDAARVRADVLGSAIERAGILAAAADAAHAAGAACERSYDALMTR